MPGALSLVRELTRRQKKVFYFTNNSSRSQRDYVMKLRRMGFKVSAEQVVMSTHSLIRYLNKTRYKKIFLLGTPSMKQMLRTAGVRLISISKNQKPDVVVVGFDKTLTYSKLESACFWVSKGVPYVVTHPDYFCPTERGPQPDCGAFAKVIELATGIRPKAVLGKPNPLMLDEALERAQAKKSDTVLVGDRLSTDIAMGRSGGIDTVLVLTGEAKRQDLKNSRLRPKFVIEGVHVVDPTPTA